MSFGPTDRASARLIRGRIIRTLYTSGKRDVGLSQEILHSTVCGGPKDPDYLRPQELEAHLYYLDEAGYLSRREETDPLLDAARVYWRLSRVGVDLYEGVAEPDAGVDIRR